MMLGWGAGMGPGKEAESVYVGVEPGNEVGSVYMVGNEPDAGNGVGE